VGDWGKVKGRYAALFSEFPFAKFRARPTRRSIVFVFPIGPGETRDDIWSLSSHSMNPPGSSNKQTPLVGGKCKYSWNESHT
jgi:hypothetical protein